MKMKLSTKLIGGFGAVIAIFLAFAGFVSFELLEFKSDIKAFSGLTTEVGMARQMQLHTANLWQYITDASLTQDKEVLGRDAKAELDAALQLRDRLVEMNAGQTEHLRVLEELRTSLPEMLATGTRMAEAYGRNRADGDVMMQAFDGESQQAIEAVSTIVKEMDGEATAASAEMQVMAARVLWITGIACLVGVVVAIAFGIALSLSITRALNRVIEALRSGSDQVASASEQTSASSQSVAQSAAEMAASLEETSSSIEELTSMIQQNADHAGQANQLMKDTRATVENSNGAMEKMKTGMNEIKTNSDDISKIIRVIEEIAFQTNLLALNAAVEAARAGEHGKGFAVVAEEVRSLAQRAGASARDTGALIEKAVKNVNDGLIKVAGVAKGLKEITESSVKVGNLVEEISNASREQAQGINQINTAVSEMDKTTQGVAANSEETAAAAEEMSSQAVSLQENVQSLVALVEGTSDGKDSAVRKSAAAPKKFAGHPAPAASKLKRRIDPEKIIPLKGDDFSEF